ncbi:MAG: Tat pathway signal protein [Euryarchaeota archaeon]|nr:Tat pathway signal protein [Euryarchaeota archaeon]
MELPGPNASRRRFLKAALAVGGASALSACLDRFGDEPIPQGVDDPTTLPDRQFAWNDSLDRDDGGNVVLPEHHLFLYVRYDGEASDGIPTATDRDTLEAALRTIERAFEWSNRGVVFDLGYSPRYFDRFEASLPDSIDLPPPTRLTPVDTPTLDDQDALLHLASDRSDALMRIEETLFGTGETLNGVDVAGRLGDVFAVDDRRTGFIGPGLPAANQGIGGIPEDGPVPEESPLFMGFKAGFAANQATEAYVTIQEGPFAGGTTKHVARIRQQLDKWYAENSHDEMVSKLFSPRLAESGAVEGVGTNLGDDSGITEEIYERIDETASEFGLVGHAEKAARANRDSEGNVRTLRRHVESTDNDNASLQFPSYQQGIGEFEAVQEAMNGTDLVGDHPEIDPRVKNGIFRYIFVENRGNFLVPPRSVRAFPTPTGSP